MTTTALIEASPKREVSRWNLVFAGSAVILFGIIYLQRIGYNISYNPGGGASQEALAVTVMTTALGLAIYWMSGRMWVDYARLGLFSLALGIMLLSMLNYSFISFLSVMLFFVCYVPYVFVIPVRKAEYLKILNLYNNLMIPIAILAVFQIGANLTGATQPQWLDQFIPQQYLIQGFNVKAQLVYETLTGRPGRANAMFFLEPSFLSQFVGISILIELIWFKRWWRLGLYGSALFASFSGTGTILVAIFVPLWAIMERRYVMLLLLVIAVAMIAIIPKDENTLIGSFLSRSGEISSEGSSGYIRFVGPFVAIPARLGNDWNAWLLGFGPGSTRYVYIMGGANLFPFSKLMVEYGVLGTFPFMLFLFHAFFSRKFNLLLPAALFFMFNLLSGGLIAPFTAFFYLVIAIIFVPEEEVDIIEKPAIFASSVRS